MRYALMILAMTAAAAGPAAAQTPPAPPPTAPMAPQAQAAWLKVRQALTPSQQAFEVRAFVAAATTERGRRPEWAIDARDVASGRAVPLDDPALLQRELRLAAPPDLSWLLEAGWVVYIGDEEKARRESPAEWLAVVSRTSG